MRPNKNPQLPIGIFDSGFGGLSVLQKIHELLPNENLIYLADTAYLPYGEKSKELIEQRTLQCAKYLQSLPVKLLVIACHTASAYAIKILQKSIDIPIVSIMDVSFQGLQTINVDTLGIIATRATIASGVYQEFLAAACPKIKILSIEAPILVPLIEEGMIKDPILFSTIEHYLQKAHPHQMDLLFLGCTHYPLIKGIFQKFVKNVFDPSLLCAKECKKTLNDHNFLNSGPASSCSFFVTDNSDKFSQVGKTFFSRIKRVKTLYM